MEWLYIVILAVLLLLILLTLGSGLYFYNFAIKRKHRNYMLDQDMMEELFEGLAENQQWFNEHGYQEVHVESFDGFRLHGKLLKQKKQSKRFAIVTHGYVGQGMEMVGFARLFHQMYDMNVLLPDLRGHGKSEGHYIGFGHHDSQDILKWVHYLISLYGPDIEIVLYGISMGGATVLLTNNQALPHQVKFIISDCAYDGIRNIMSYQMKRRFKLPNFPIIHMTSFITKLKAKYSFNDGCVYEAVRKSNIPILFIHGDQDRFVPTDMCYNIYNSCASEKDILIVPNARHGEAYRLGSDDYQLYIKRFIDKYMTNVTQCIEEIKD